MGLAHPTAGLTVAGGSLWGTTLQAPCCLWRAGLLASGAERRGRVVIVKHDAAATGWAEGRHEPAPLSLLAGPSVHLRPRDSPPPPTQPHPGAGTQALPWFPLTRAGMLSDFSHQGRKVGGTEWESEAQRQGPTQGHAANQWAGGGQSPPPRPPVPPREPQRGAPCALTAPPLSACPRGVDGASSRESGDRPLVFKLPQERPEWPHGHRCRRDAGWRRPPLQWPQSGRSSPEHRTPTPFSC